MKRKKTSNKKAPSKKQTPASKGVKQSFSAHKQPRSASKKVYAATKPSQKPASKSTKELKIDKALRALAAAKDAYDKIPPQLREKAIGAAGQWLNRQDSRAPEKEAPEVPQDLETFSLSLFSNSFDESADLCIGLFGQNFFWRGRARRNQEHPISIAAQHVPIGDFSETRSGRTFETAIARADLIFTTLDGGAATLSRSTIRFCKWILSTAQASRRPLLFIVLNSEENLTYGHEFVTTPGMRRRWTDLMKRRKTVFANAIGCGRDQLFVVSRAQKIGLPFVAKQALLLLQDHSKKQILISAFLPGLIQVSATPAPSALRNLFKGATDAIKTGSKRAAKWARDNPELATVLATLLKEVLMATTASDRKNQSAGSAKRRRSARKR